MVVLGMRSRGEFIVIVLGMRSRGEFIVILLLGMGSRGEFVLVSTSFTGSSTNLLKKTERNMVINKGSSFRSRCTISHFNLPVFLFYFMLSDYYTYLKTIILLVRETCMWEHF